MRDTRARLPRVLVIFWANGYRYITQLLPSPIKPRRIDRASAVKETRDAFQVCESLSPCAISFWRLCRRTLWPWRLTNASELRRKVNGRYQGLDMLISRSIGVRSPIDPSPRRLPAGGVETGAFPRVHNPSAPRLVRNDRHPTNTRAVTGPHEAVARAVAVATKKPTYY